MAITDEIKKRKEDREMEEKKKIETISNDTTSDAKTVIIDGTPDIIEIAEPKAEEKKVEKVVEEKADKKEEVVKVEKKEDVKVVEKKEDSQKKDLEKYEAEDKAKASEKPKEEKETAEKSQEAKPEEIVEDKIEKEVVTEEKKVVEGEKVEEKPEIKADNSIVTDEEFEKLVVEDISKPYPNEHAARIRPVSDFQEGSFRSKQIAEGIRIIIGRLIGETTATVQSYRFHIDHFTAEEAKQWLKDHEITYILFEPATKPEETEENKEEKLFELLNKLNDKLDALSEKINALELANQAKIKAQGNGGRDTCYCSKCDKEVPHDRGTPCIEQVCPDCGEKLLPEKPKAEEKKEEPKVEEKVEEKPQRKSFIADAPYANDRKDEEKKEKDTKKTTDRGWSQIVYGKK